MPTKGEKQRDFIARWSRKRETALWTGLGGERAAAWRQMDENPVAWLGQLEAWAEHTKRTARYEFQAKTGGTGEIYIYGPIGQDFFGDGITGDRFRKELKALGRVKTIDLHVDSPGGAVTDARTIYTLLTQHEAEVRVHIDGYAASAASVVAMAGDDIAIAEGGFLMIHEARGVARGTAADMEKAAQILRAITDTISDTYVVRSGQSKKQIDAWMAAETWFKGQAAVDAGLATRILENKTAKASAYAAAFGAMPRDLLPRRARARRLIAKIERAYQ
jgi:ATP-dependent protease ClpP protease subunit